MTDLKAVPLVIPKAAKRDQVIPVRVSAGTKQLLELIAYREGLPLSLMVSIWVKSKVNSIAELYDLKNDPDFIKSYGNHVSGNDPI
jgi:hypothetical protein